MHWKVKVCFQLQGMNRCFFVLFLVLFLDHTSLSQGNDGFLRINPTFSYKLNKKWKTEIDYRLTLNDNMSKLRSNHIQTVLSYKIIKSLRFDVAYRYTTRNTWNNHRFMTSVNFKHKFQHFSITTRTRFQFSTVNFDPYFMNQIRQPRVYLRQKFAVKYPIPNSKIKVFAASEIFFRLRNENIAWHRMRYQIGIEKGLKFGNTIGLRVIYEDRIRPSSQDRFILTLKYDLSIDTMRKKILKKRKKARKLNRQDNSEF